MPTGYTHNVGDGTLTEFKDFAMQCARAFGALITMRDDPANAEIPQTFEPDGYYLNRLNDAKAELAQLDAMSEDDIRQACIASNEREAASHKKYIQDKADTRARYEAMLEKVAKWSPPTPDHEQMKTFMMEQLSTSIDCDCSTRYWNEPKEKTPTEWLNERRDDLNRTIADSRDEYAKEIDRCVKRTKWVADLRASLSQIEEERSIR